MFTHETTLRVRYGETDQMGFMYYGNYAEFLEVGRVEALRSLGFSYRELEEQGMLLPVHDMSISYHLPASYDELVTVQTSIVKPPSVRIEFTYVLLNAAGERLTDARTTLVFVDRITGKPTRAPQALVEVLAPYFVR